MSDAAPPNRSMVTIAAAAPDGDSELVSDMRLVPVDGGAAIALGDRAVIGTSELATVRIDDRTVSRLHCEIAVVGGRPRIRDLSSSNGTLVGDVEVIEAMLADGAVIRIGSRSFRFEVGTESHRRPLTRAQSFGKLCGRSLAMRRVFTQLEQAAATDSTVLLIAETGTGKEVAADAIQQASLRRDRPFIVVDCGAAPSELLESELFGHEKGAFTSAHTTRVGAFEAADGGTIFLDEIGELPIDLQPKLLRVLSKREIKRIGRNDYRPVDVRVIAATNRNLLDEVDRKNFRADLYYRLAVVEAHLPPLRERLEDLDLLVGAFCDELGVSGELRGRLTSRAVIRQLARHGWPGNVRELRNFVERSVVTGTMADLHPGLGNAPAPPPPPAESPAPPAESPAAPAELADALAALDPAVRLKDARDRWNAAFEKRYLVNLLDAHQGNVRAAAAAAGIDRVYLYRLLWKHGVRQQGPSEPPASQ
jgi:two-component system, NtrC family, response regulator GlrR